VTISRAAGTLTFPANFVLVGVMNPCPCGYLGDPVKECTCSPMMISRCRKRISARSWTAARSLPVGSTSTSRCHASSTPPSSRGERQVHRRAAGRTQRQPPQAHRARTGVQWLRSEAHQRANREFARRRLASTQPPMPHCSAVPLVRTPANARIVRNAVVLRQLVRTRPKTRGAGAYAFVIVL